MTVSAAATTAVTRTAGILLALAMLAGAAVVAAPAARAAAGVTVSNPEGTATADPDYATEMTVRGDGFQSIPKGFGGVYVMFGWVDDPSGGSWRPSRGGVVGSGYRYVPDSETQDNQGFLRFVAFPGSETEGAAHAVMSADGSWSVSMVIPGAVFQSRDRSGDTSSVDCREVTCGVITVGAHGVKNANNETFTPVSFVAPATAPGETPDVATPGAVPGDVRVGLASASVRAGASIVFTGQGFAPGEQVVAALDDGVTAIGPLTAGSRGEVAGALPVPRDARGGTHLVSLTGAASGAVAQAEVAIAADASAAPVVDDQQVPQWAVLVLLVAIAIAIILVVASALTSVRRAVVRRRAHRTAAALSAATTSAGPPQSGGAGALSAGTGVSSSAVDQSPPTQAGAVDGSTRDELAPTWLMPAVRPEPLTTDASVSETAPTEILSVPEKPQ